MDLRTSVAVVIWALLAAATLRWEGHTGALLAFGESIAVALGTTRAGAARPADRYRLIVLLICAHVGWALWTGLRLGEATSRDALLAAWATSTAELRTTALALALRKAGAPVAMAAVLTGLLGVAIHRAHLRPQLLVLGVAVPALAHGLLTDPSPLSNTTPLTRVRDQGLLRVATPAAMPALGRREYLAFQKVILVVMESVGAHNLAPVLAEAGPLQALAARSLYARQVLAPSNVSHMAQPAILFSRDFSPSGSAVLQALRPPQPLYGAADWFHDSGFRTVMVSSQDERWLGLDKVIAAGPWDRVIHARTTPRKDALYWDACGTIKVFDSATLESFIAELEASSGPVFGYINLQNTHFPYISEQGPQPVDFEGLTCSDFLDMPDDKVMSAQRRYTRALHELESRIGRLANAFPDALIAILGDHGEELVSGTQFAHSKNLTARQVATSLFLAGPGITPTVLDHPVSALDLLPTLVELATPERARDRPRDLFSGASLLTTPQQKPAYHFAVAHGWIHEVTATNGGVQLRETDAGRHCQAWGEGASAPTLPMEQCRDLRVRLAQWLRCQTYFGDPQNPQASRWFNPCQRVFRAPREPKGRG